MSVHDQLELAFTFHWNTQKEAVFEALQVYRMSVLSSALTQRVVFTENVGSGGQCSISTTLIVFASAEVTVLANEILGTAHAEKAAEWPSRVRSRQPTGWSARLASRM
jgi:hypothetical protein